MQKPPANLPLGSRGLEPENESQATGGMSDVGSALLIIGRGLTVEMESTNSYTKTKQELGQPFFPIQDDVPDFSPEEAITVSDFSLLSTCLCTSGCNIVPAGK